MPCRSIDEGRLKGYLTQSGLVIIIITYLILYKPLPSLTNFVNLKTRPKLNGFFISKRMNKPDSVPFFVLINQGFEGCDHLSMRAPPENRDTALAPDWVYHLTMSP